MSPLYTQDGKLLVVDGKLAGNENCCCDDCFCWVEWQSSTTNSASGIITVGDGIVNVEVTSSGPVYLRTGDDLNAWVGDCATCAPSGNALFFSDWQGPGYGGGTDSANFTYSFSLSVPANRVVLPVVSLGRYMIPVTFSFSEALTLVNASCPLGDNGINTGFTVNGSSITGTGESSIVELDGQNNYTNFSMTTGPFAEFFSLLYLGIPCDTPSNP